MPRERLALALLSFAAVVFEIALTRLASVLLHAALAPLVIAACLAGLGLGASFAARAPLSPPAAAAITTFGGGFALAAVVKSPLGWASGAFALPFFGVGAFASALYGQPGRSRLTYAADVLGGAAGAGLAPALLPLLGDVNLALAAIALAAIAGLIVGGRPAVFATALALTVFAFAVPVLEVDPFANFAFPTHLVTQTQDRGGRVAASAWDGLVRSDLVLTREPNVRYMFTDRMYTARIARWDGTSSSFDDPELQRLAALKGLAFRALKPRDVLVLGAGGGFDVALALQAGARHVDAVEINPAMIRWTRAAGPFAGDVYGRTEVSVHDDEARRFVRATSAHYDLISLSLMQTEPAFDRTATGFQSWVFTTEAVGDYLDRLAPGGVVAIVQNTELIAARTVATAMAGLARRGVSRDAAGGRVAHLALTTPAGNPFAHLLLIANEPFSGAALAALQAEALASGAELRPASLPQPGPDAPSDERPFFYDAEGARPLVFWLTGGAASLLLLLAFARDRMRLADASLGTPAWIAAAALGAGFMLLEAGLLSRGQFLLGYPTVTLALVLGGLLAAAGIAAAASAGVAARPAARLVWGAALVAGLALAEALSWPSVRDLSRGLPATGASAVVLGLVAAVGAPAGLCLPALIELAGAGASSVYAASALATVAGGSAATLLARSFGLTSGFVAAGLLYAIPALLALRLERHGQHRLAGLASHLPADRREGEHLAHILSFVAGHADPFDRRIAEGHLTGSALVVSAAGDRVLLLHHKKLERWLQPGGHADPGERSGEAVALREAREETGIEGLALHASAPRPLDVDVHAIPARGSELAHEHLDLRYLVVAPDAAVARLKADESHAIRWFTWQDLPGLDLDPGLVRALAKARAFWR